MQPHRPQLTYVLITPARNEAAFIEQTLSSVTRQTVLPLKWVIVDDGSTDATAAIVRRYLPMHPWIELLQMEERKDRSFAGKVFSFNAGYERVRGLDYDVIGNVDADTSFEDDHFEFLLARFQEDIDLGVAGTIFLEEGYRSDTDSFEGQSHVSGQCQLFRRRCFADIGGYTPHRAGGIDWMAVTTARMLGWKTRSFRDKAFFHHRRLGTAERSPFAAMFSYGEKDYYLGGHPLWQLFRVAYRMTKRPYVIGGIGLALGYGWAAARRMERPVSEPLMAFHRREQLLKLKAIVTSLVKRKRLDAFTVASS
jgi:hypothetical protein